MLSKLQHFGLMIKNAIIKHPIEILFVTYVTAISILNVGDYRAYQAQYSLENLMALAPICFIVLYLARNTKIYWFLIPLPIVIALFFDEIKPDLLSDSRYWAIALCTFLCLISQHWHKNNYYFVSQMTDKLINIAFALLLAIAIFAALSTIHYAIIELFKLDKNYNTSARFWVFSVFWAFPVLFLTLERQKNINDSIYLNRVGEILLNWILSPALIIYTAIIYAYVAFIAVQAQMPNGIIANVAFPYLSLGLAIQAVQLLLQNAKWQWFYRSFSYLALLPLALVWYAIYIRLNHYGLTEARIYLVIGAVALSICYGLLLSKYLAQYRAFSAISIVIILFSVFILDPKTIALDDQTKRLDSYLLEHQLFDANHKINKDAVIEYKKSLGDNRDEIERLNSMIRYVSRENTNEKFKEKYGIDSWDLLNEYYNKYYNLKTFEARHTELFRLTKADMVEAKEYIILNMNYYRPRVGDYRRTEDGKCQPFAARGYSLDENQPSVKYHEEIFEDCSQIAPKNFEFNVYFQGAGVDIEINIDDFLKKIFAKHNLAISEYHNPEILEKIKDDLLKIDLGNAVLGLSDIKLQFEENSGYFVEQFGTRYLMLK